MLEKALQRVAAAYGARLIPAGPLRKFQHAVMRDWVWNDKNWPRRGDITTKHEELLKRIDTLCDDLKKGHQLARAQGWPEPILLQYLHGTLVSCAFSPCFVCPCEITRNAHMHCRTLRSVTWRPSSAKLTWHLLRKQFLAKVSIRSSCQKHVYDRFVSLPCKAKSMLTVPCLLGIARSI